MSLESEVDPRTEGESLARACARVRDAKACQLKAIADLAEVRRLETLGPSYSDRVELVRRRKYLDQKIASAARDLAHHKRVALDVQARARKDRCDEALGRVNKLVRPGPEADALWTSEGVFSVRAQILELARWAFADPPRSGFAPGAEAVHDATAADCSRCHRLTRAEHLASGLCPVCR